MKAKVVAVLDLDNPEKEMWGIMISRGKGKRSLPGCFDGKPYYTFNKSEAETKVKKFNLKQSTDALIAELNKDK